MTRWLRRTQVRLALAYSGIFTVVALVAALGLWLGIRQFEYTAIDDSLTAQARSLALAIATGSGNSLPGSAGQVAATQSNPTGTVSVLLFDADGRLLDSIGPTGDAGALLPLVRTAAGPAASAVDSVDVVGTPRRVRASRVDLTAGGSRVLVLSRSLDEVNQLLDTIATGLLAGTVVLIFAASVLGYGLAGTALRPVREIAETARSFSEHDLHRRLDMDLPPDELGVLADTFNEMLARLETAFDGLRRFTADAAHELRAPLTLIRTEAEVSLARTRSPEEYQESLRTILSESERLSRLAEQLLMLARAESGALATQMRPIELGAMVEEGARLWAPVAAEHRVAVRTATSGACPVRGDADLLRRLLDNLVDNAVRHSPEGGDVQVSCAVVDRTVELSVADQGPGVPPEARESIFQRFSQVDQARPRNGGGAGLGLALCAAIARLHYGTISLDEGHPDGAKFVVRLPAQGA